MFQVFDVPLQGKHRKLQYHNIRWLVLRSFLDNRVYRQIIPMGKDLMKELFCVEYLEFHQFVWILQERYYNLLVCSLQKFFLDRFSKISRNITIFRDA